MGIFVDDRPHITVHDFEHKIRPALMNEHHFTHEELDRAQLLFQQQLSRGEVGSRHSGIYADEIAPTFKYARDHHDMHLLPDHKLDAFQNEIQKHFAHEGINRH